jgi:hypothetical protein
MRTVGPRRSRRSATGIAYQREPGGWRIAPCVGGFAGVPVLRTDRTPFVADGLRGTSADGGTVRGWWAWWRDALAGLHIGWRVAAGSKAATGTGRGTAAQRWPTRRRRLESCPAHGRQPRQASTAENTQRGSRRRTAGQPPFGKGKGRPGRTGTLCRRVRPACRTGTHCRVSVACQPFPGPSRDRCIRQGSPAPPPAAM